MSSDENMSIRLGVICSWTREGLLFCRVVERRVMSNGLKTGHPERNMEGIRGFKRAVPESLPRFTKSPSSENAGAVLLAPASCLHSH